MKNKVANNLNFVAAILLGIVAMLNFFSIKHCWELHISVQQYVFVHLNFQKRKMQIINKFSFKNLSIFRAGF